MATTLRAGSGDLRTQTGNRRPAKGAGIARPGTLMDDEELQANVSAMLVDCITFTDSELSPRRAVATKYYLAEPFGNETEGRSQVVLSVVRDSVLAVIPPIMRVFFSSDRVVEFEPRRPDAVAMAQQATDYVQHVFVEENRGFQLTYGVLKDGLIRKVGVYKWAWDDSETTQAYRLTNVDDAGLEELEDDDDVTITRVVQSGWAPADALPMASGGKLPLGPTDPASGAEPEIAPGTPRRPEVPDDVADEPPESLPGQAPHVPLYTVECTRVERDGRPRVWMLPPEEFVFSREARSLSHATCIAHRTNKRRGELVAMGYDEALIAEHQADDVTLRNNLEQIARRQVIEAGATMDVPTGPENDEILYCEAYVHVDYDGDGVAELRKVCTMGLGYHVVANEPVDERPFAIFCPDPEPHTLLGQSWADRTMDLQAMQSNIMRGVLDSLSASIFPRTAYLEGAVSVADILNTEIGGPIRVRGTSNIQQAVQPLITPFTGRDGLGVLQYLDEVKEQRTGQSPGVNGLDADALQSSTKEAVTAAINATQAQQEMLVRFLAETMRDLFTGLLKLLVKHAPQKRTVRLRGKWVDVDPRAWDADMDVRVNVGLGNGLTEEKIQTLLAIAAEQKDILTQFGTANPMVTVAQYRDTLAQIAMLKGFPDASQFFKEVPPDWQPPAPQQPGPTPEMIQTEGMLAIEKEKSQRMLAIKEAELQLKQKQLILDNEIALKKAADDFTLRRYAIDAQYKATYSEQQMEADASAQERWLAAQDQAHGQALAMHQQAHDQALAQQQQQFEQQQAAQQAAQGSDQSDQPAPGVSGV